MSGPGGEEILVQLGMLRHSLSDIQERIARVENQIGSIKGDLQGRLGTVAAILETAENAGITGEAAGDTLRWVNRAVQRMDQGETQEQILEAFLEEAHTYVERALLFLSEDGRYRTWKSMGFPPASVEQLVASQAEDPVVRAAGERQLIYRPGNPEQTFTWLTSSGPLPQSAVCIPLVFADAAPIVFYGDSSKPIPIDSLELLAHLAVLVLKNNYLHRMASGRSETRAQEWQAPLPATHVSAAEASEAPADERVTDRQGAYEEPEAASAPAQEAAQTVTPAAEELRPRVPTQDREDLDFVIEPTQPVIPTTPETAGTTDRPETAAPVPAPPAPALEPQQETSTAPAQEPGSESAAAGIPETPPEAAQEEKPRVEVSFEVDTETEEPSAPPSREAAAEGEFRISFESEAPKPREFPAPPAAPTEEEGAAPEALGEETGEVEAAPPQETTTAAEPEGAEIKTPTPEAAPADEEKTEAAPEAETAPPEEEEAAAASSETEEPALSDEEERQHQEARRFARLLVSEIKLYNESTVEEARSTGNLYSRLQTDIDRSREMYNKRVKEDVSSSKDYFHEELVRILAGGDPKLLGEGYPGSSAG